MLTSAELSIIRHTHKYSHTHTHTHIHGTYTVQYGTPRGIFQSCLSAWNPASNPPSPSPSSFSVSGLFPRTVRLSLWRRPCRSELNCSLCLLHRHGGLVRVVVHQRARRADRARHLVELVRVPLLPAGPLLMLCREDMPLNLAL